VTRFDASQDVVNPLLIKAFMQLRGRIRKHANGKAGSYFLTTTVLDAPIRNVDVAIQLKYTPYPEETICYHGYPDTLTVFSLSVNKGGPDIPQ
jgi:hypothetical protein